MGLRIIAIDRLGYGWSTPFEEYGARSVASWAGDVGALTQHLGLSEYAVMVRHAASLPITALNIEQHRKQRNELTHLPGRLRRWALRALPRPQPPRR